ncbi:MAG: 5'-methylthioadenosine/adenosylhomocysteine nucleosidase [Ruminococcaceae bacterium]|nr:5'-methylthioadenosine/adenosylhomocysteine nucleosidase [Oscillospiraceae bacterium]
MIGIIGAMEVEVAALKSEIENKEVTEISGIEFVKGDLCGKEVVVAKCGVGKVFAALCAQTMILKFAPDCIINTGVAGSLSEKLGVCDVAIAESVVQHDMDTSAIGDPVGLISGINIINIPADKNVSELLTSVVSDLGINTYAGAIASGDQFISSAEKKSYITNTFCAVACEMEGAAIGHVCYVNNVPFGVVRAISDNADGTSHMDFPTFAAKAAEISIKTVKEFVKRKN